MPDIKVYPPREGTKLAGRANALKGRGASMSKLSDQLEWQPHTVRAAITRLRQRGYVVTRKKSKKTGLSIYLLTDPSA